MSQKRASKSNTLSLSHSPGVYYKCCVVTQRDWGQNIFSLSLSISLAHQNETRLETRPNIRDVRCGRCDTLQSSNMGILNNVAPVLRHNRGLLQKGLYMAREGGGDIGYKRTERMCIKVQSDHAHFVGKIASVIYMYVRLLAGSCCTTIAAVNFAHSRIFKIPSEMSVLPVLQIIFFFIWFCRGAEYIYTTSDNWDFINHTYVTSSLEQC